MTMRRIGVMQEFTRGEKRELRGRALRARGGEVRSPKRAPPVAAIERDTALAWLDRYYAEAMAAVIAEQADAGQARNRCRRGRLSRRAAAARPTSSRAHGTLAALDDRASEYASRIAQRQDDARALDRRRRRRAARRPTPAIDTLRLDPSARGAPPTHPEIAVLAKQEEIAATEARIAQAAQEAGLDARG